MNQQTADEKEELLKWADNHANVIENEWMINLTAIKARIEMAFNSLVREEEPRHVIKCPDCKEQVYKFGHDCKEQVYKFGHDCNKNNAYEITRRIVMKFIEEKGDLLDSSDIGMLLTWLEEERLKRK